MVVYSRCICARWLGNQDTMCRFCVFRWVLDVQQSMIGSCSLEDVAVRVLTRVVGHCPHRNQLLIDCGWTGIRWLYKTSPVSQYLICAAVITEIAN